MTKIHPFAFGSKLDGYADSAVSDRLQALQFLTPDDLNVEARARDETVLALAQVGVEANFRGNEKKSSRHK